jgi:hypothetical protein
LLVAQRFLKIDGDFIEDRYVHLCDVIDEGANMLQTNLYPPIVCNSTILFRESIEDYVYDIYMSQSHNVDDISMIDWTTLSSIDEPELVHDVFDSDENVYEEEDDSNDENNWRNDYPDEPSLDDSSEDDSSNANCGDHCRSYYSG